MTLIAGITTVSVTISPFLCPHPHPQQVCFAITLWQTTVH